MYQVFISDTALGRHYGRQQVPTCTKRTVYLSTFSLEHKPARTERTFGRQTRSHRTVAGIRLRGLKGRLKCSKIQQAIPDKSYANYH